MAELIEERTLAEEEAKRLKQRRKKKRKRRKNIMKKSRRGPIQRMKAMRSQGGRKREQQTLLSLLTPRSMI